MQEPIQPWTVVLCVNPVGSNGALLGQELYTVVEVTCNGAAVYLKGFANPFSCDRFQYYDHASDYDFFYTNSFPKEMSGETDD